MKERLDVLLVKRGLAPSRGKGKDHDYGRQCICQQ